MGEQAWGLFSLLMYADVAPRRGLPRALRAVTRRPVLRQHTSAYTKGVHSCSVAVARVNTSFAPDNGQVSEAM